MVSSRVSRWMWTRSQKCLKILTVCTIHYLVKVWYQSCFAHSAARESHKAQRALLNERRAAKPHSALLFEAKKAWSLARQKNITKNERTKYINALMEIIRGRVKEIVFKHDASRIVQTVVKYGGQKERNEIALELKGKYPELAQNKYSKVRSLS